MGRSAFTDREDAGQRLGEQIKALALKSPRVLAMTRGGLLVARGIARSLGAPVSMAPAPRAPTLEATKYAAVAPDSLTNETSGALSCCDIVLVDDGIITGALASAIINSVRQEDAGRIVVATPIASTEAVSILEKTGVEIAVLHTTQKLVSVADYFDEYEVINEEKVQEILSSRETGDHRVGGSETVSHTLSVPLKTEAGTTEAQVTLLEGAHALVIVAAGKTTDAIERSLGRAGYSLLVVETQLTAELLRKAIRWAQERAGVSDLPIAVVAEWEGVAAALELAAGMPEKVRAIVSISGRPDLARNFLASVQIPVLFILASDDEHLMGLTREASETLRSESNVIVMPGPEINGPGALGEVSRITEAWLERFVASPRAMRAVPPPMDLSEPDRSQFDG